MRFKFVDVRFVLILGVLLFSKIGAAQQGIITGLVLDDKQAPLAGVTIQVTNHNSGHTITDIDGTFKILLPQGKYTLKASYLGFKTTYVTVDITKNTTQNIKIALIVNEEVLESVVVEGQTKIEQLKSRAFEVEAIAVKAEKNASIDVNGILATVPGVNIRQSGGLGSNFNFSLNGFSGNQVRFFIDGIPQDNLGSSLRFNNFPATLVDRVEVYKGVVPIHLGADALGGAVNIVTSQKQTNFLDVSYDVGSFTTHRATLNGRYYTKEGLTLQLIAFYNYSDNDYTINGNEFGKEGFAIRDEFGNDTGERVPTARRFHDAYTSQMVQFKAGVVNKPFADKLLIGVTFSGNNDEVQHGVTAVDPFNDVETEETVFKTTLEYHKNAFADKLKLKLYGEYASINRKITDTSSRKYTWFRTFQVRRNPSIGETWTNKTQLAFDDVRHLFNTSAVYKLHDNHKLSANYTKNYLERSGEDPIRDAASPFENPNAIDKHTVGASYTVTALQKHLSTVVLGKGFFVNTASVLEDVFTSNPEERLTNLNSSFNAFGYGIASTYKVTKQLRVKASFEKTIRIPESYEFFGDGLNLIANPELAPEESKNLNIGVLYNISMPHLKIKFDANYFNRDAKNFLFLRVLGNRAQYINRTQIESNGIEGEITINPYKRLRVNANITYLNIQDAEINERVANIPYLYGNFSTGYTFKMFKAQNNLYANWHTFYTKSFPFESFTNGEEDARRFIPEQLSHNIQLGYTLHGGKYNFAVLASNITNARLFDNLTVQKPGRAFYFKIRYQIQ